MQIKLPRDKYKIIPNKNTNISVQVFLQQSNFFYRHLLFSFSSIHKSSFFYFFARSYMSKYSRFFFKQAVNKLMNGTQTVCRTHFSVRLLVSHRSVSFVWRESGCAPERTRVLCHPLCIIICNPKILIIRQYDEHKLCKWAKWGPKHSALSIGPRLRMRR